jgi:glycosyltransferase involved in cell wall biosynthesis
MYPPKSYSVKKILFIVAHRPGRSPGQRFRFEQYLDHLRKNGFVCDISFLLNEKDDFYFYRKGYYFRKLIILLKTIHTRLDDLKKAKNYDIVFLYREAVMFGSAWFEKRFRKKVPLMVLDFDDAIWLKDVSDGNRNLSWLKRPSKTADIIRLCNLVITGNHYLSDYASQFNKNTVVVPTTIDTNQFNSPVKGKENNKICIGWTGSTTTLRHLQNALPILKRIFEKYGDRVILRVIADREWEHPSVNAEFIKWRRETEIKDLAEMDIGIMPLPDDDWAKGKCGFKGLQYMALGIPAVMSPVGVNNEIIQDGKNGFLAATEDEWIEKLSLLIENPELRQSIGAAGRQTVEMNYSFNAWKNKYVELFNKLIQDKRQQGA